MMRPLDLNKRYSLRDRTAANCQWTSRMHMHRVLFASLLIAVLLVMTPALLIADDHGRGGEGRYEHEQGDDWESQDDRERERGKLEPYGGGDEPDEKENDDDEEGREQEEGNETTGLATAALLVMANITVVMSLVVKLILSLMPNHATGRSSLIQFNGLQKKHLRALHYWLNPAALILAGTHFYLSTCGSTMLPECGLALMAVLVLTGLTLKMKFLPRTLSKPMRQVHTSSIGIILMTMVLIAGHTIID